MINTPRKNSKYYNISSSLEILLFLYFPGIQNKIIAKNMQIALFFYHIFILSLPTHYLNNQNHFDLILCLLNKPKRKHRNGNTNLHKIID